jgi:hypothetical protein
MAMKYIRQNEIQNIYQCTKCEHYYSTSRDEDAPDCTNPECDDNEPMSDSEVKAMKEEEVIHNAGN